MILEQVEIQNFRQFANRQTLEFAEPGPKNVTVVHGYNGSGKTTLLNAFVWLFYGSFTPDFEDTSRLANEGRWEKIDVGGRLTVSVKSRFTHSGRRYIAERKKVVEKLEGNAREVKVDGDLTLSVFTGDGELQNVGGPQDTMEQILPKKLYPFFFFNGERIERLASPKAYEEVEKGIKVLLDIELLDRAIKHLEGRTARDLRGEVTEHSGNEGKEIRAKREKLSDDLNNLRNEKKQVVENRNSLEEERDRINNKLRAQPELASLQKEREMTEKNLKQKNVRLKETRQEIAELFSEDAYVPIVSSTLTEALSILDDAHEDGQLPPPLRRQFVDELLDRGECICGHPLEEDSEHRRKVKDWRSMAGSEEIARIATTTRAEINKVLRKRGKNFRTKLDRLQAQRNTQSEEKRTLQARLSEISSKIGDEAEEDFEALESRRQKIDETIQSLEIKRAEFERDIKEREKEIKEKDEKIQSLEQADARGRLAQRRLEAVQNVASALEKIRDLQQQSVRQDLSQSLHEVWSSIAIKDYKASLDSEYRLRLTKSVGGSEEPVRGASTGEKQVLSLAFVSSLVRKAREQYNGGQSGSALFSGGKYPLVMDSPFGSLEVDYRRQVADWVPRLAPQIVIIVSETQWRSEVEQEITPKIGKEWILECYTPKHRSKDIELHGCNYPYVVSAHDGFEKTDIKQVNL